ncbi:MAG TPA: lytic transglycosylase domain-containing protein [Caldimonas sp.]|nr:lytic transglycosylase domain-containing protein [Caldimonas sp.]
MVTACSAVASLAALPRAVRAGAQVEEPLADAVRTALSAAIAERAPPQPPFDSVEARLSYLRWLGDMSERLKKRTSDHVARLEFLQTLWYESVRARHDPALMLGLVQVESNFRKYAISAAGARGYAQVMPFWARLIGDGDDSKLFRTQVNLRFGCVILRHYLELEAGDLYMALGRYNGSRGRPEYPMAVLGAKRAWEHASA